MSDTLQLVPLCAIDEIADSCAKGFEIDGHNLFAVHKDGQFHVYHNRCPHIGVQLEWQPDDFLDMDKYFIQCSMHGALFQIDSGECVSGPCQGDSLSPVSSLIENGKLIAQLETET